MRTRLLALLAAFVTAPVRADAPPPEAVRIDAGTYVTTRGFAYDDAPELHDLRATAPTFAVRGEVFPGAFFPPPPAAAIGLYFELSRSWPFETTHADGERFDTVYGTRELGLVSRHRIRRQALLVRIGYGAHRFELERAKPSIPEAIPDVPSATYRFVRLHAESILRLAQAVRITPSFAYLPVFDAGGLESSAWFPRATSGGITAGLEGAYRAIDAVEIFVSFEYRRFFHDFHPEPGDRYDARGAIDASYVTGIGARYLFHRKEDGRGPSNAK